MIKLGFTKGNDQKELINLLENMKNDFQILRNRYEDLKTEMKKMAVKHKIELQQLKDERTKQIGDLLQTFGTGVSKMDPNNDEHSLNNSLLAKKNDYGNTKHRRLLFPSTPVPHHAKLVAFSFDLSREVTNLGHFHTIVYDHELLNVGNAYNKNDGIFTVPVSGIYLFNWSTMTAHDVFQGTELVADGKHVSYSYSSDTNGYESSGKTVIIDVQQGSTVWIRTDNVSSDRTAHALRGDGYNSFSGFLIYPRE